MAPGRRRGAARVACKSGVRLACKREILGERYARGEISTEEYHERLDALR